MQHTPVRQEDNEKKPASVNAEQHKTSPTGLSTYHGPIPTFGMAVGATNPFTSCWMILNEKKDPKDWYTVPCFIYTVL